PDLDEINGRAATEENRMTSHRSAYAVARPNRGARKIVARLGAALCLFALAAAAGCGGGGGVAPGADGKEGGKVTLILGAYTTPREAYSKAILPAFQKFWKDKTGQDVEFQESYQGSGAQARAIVAGFEADIAA